ncbi:hypothetical protein AGMMS50289_05950 [Betaproteobacteria bacterium]|nr:hypothetical protein AGMMS50289_05950 [Betaproteobacteria bacterium]
MVTIASGFGKELDVINARTLTSSSDGIGGADVENQKLWALSDSEWNAIGNNGVRSYPSQWWLRSPDDGVAFLGEPGGDSYIYFNTLHAVAVRPAFNLDLKSVLFASDASTSGDGKSAAAAGGDYQPLAPTAARKFTFRNTSIAAPALTLKSTPLDFDFSGVSTGTNQYLSGFLSTPSGDLYAKYAQSASGNLNPTSASDFPTANGDYILHIFSEEANTYLYSDFASESLDFTFAINGGTVKNITLTSDSPFALDGGTIGLLAKSYTKAWTLGTGGGTFAIQNSVSAEISGVVSGGDLTKDGAGKLTLSDTNTYSGVTTINAGTLALSGNGSIEDSSGVTLANVSGAIFDISSVGGSGTTIKGLIGGGASGGNVTLDSKNLTVNNGGANSYGGVISGNGSLTKDGAGTLMLSNTNNYDGGTTVNAGLINFANAGNFGATGKNITLNGGGLQWATSNTTDISGKLTDLGVNGGTFDTNGNDVTLANTISGTGSLTKTGDGILELTGANNYNGGTTVSGTGTLKGNTNSLQGNILNNANVEFAQATNGNYDGTMSGGGSLTKTGSQTLTLTSPGNNYSGNTTVSAGTLEVTGLLGNGVYGGDITYSGALIFNQTAPQILSGDISGNGSLTKDNTGTLILSGTNIYSGATTIKGGVLQLANSAAVSNATSFNTGTTGSTGTLTLAFDGGFDKDVGGAGNLTANPGDSNTLTLSGTNGYTGMTTVQSGTLELGSALTSTYLTLLDGTKFNRNGQTHTLDSGSLTVHGSATYTGNLSANGGTLNFYVPNSTTSGATLLDVVGDADVTSSTIHVGIEGSSSPLTAGDHLVLIDATGTLTDTGRTGTGATATRSAVMATQGVTLVYTFNLSVETNQLIASLPSAAPPPPVTPPPARTTPADLIWTGATDRNWNILTSENWTPESTFINGDTVTFTDTGFGQVNIVTPGVAPAATIFTNTQGHDYRVSGTISGTGTLTKTGNGNLTLTGNNTYSGNTIINAGSLTLALSGALPNSNVSIASPATFNLYNRVGKNLTLANAARLNVYQGAAITGNLSAIGSLLNFYLPAIATNGYSLLNVGGTANITNSTVNVGILGSSSPLTAGDTITLINAANLTGNPANTIAHGTGMQGVSLLYDFDLTTNGKQLLATVAGGTPPIDPNPPVTPPIDPNPPVTPPVDPNPPTDPTPPVTPPTNPGINLNPQTKALAEGFLSGTAFLNQAQDFAAERGIHSALQTVQSSDKHGFAAIGYSTLRHNTGSHVDVDGYTLLAGLAATTPTQTGNLTTAAFIEHGEGNYDSYNSFSNAASVHGKGDTQYTGAGILARFAFDETQAAPLYLDASIRSGKVKTDFSGNLYDGFGRAAAYNAKSTYVSAHVGAGYVINLTEQSKLDVYGQYLWSHQNGDTVKLTTGETVKFEAVDSQRTKLGAKWHHALNAKTTAYVGAAWEHEYNGKANASIYGYKLDAPKLKGDTGVLEAGLTLTPTAANQQGWSLDLGVQGYTGKREGVTGSLRARYRF